MKNIFLLLTILAFSCQKENISDDNLVNDKDGNVYKTVTIGTQVWMAENLKTTKYNDGTEITYGADNTTWQNNTSGAYSWYFNNEDPYKVTFGALYNYYAVKTCKLCPSGWHVSTINDWTNLIDFLGGDGENVRDLNNVNKDVVNKLKEMGTVHWFASNTTATNESGFTALPGGIRVYSPGWGWEFLSINRIGYWWTSETQRYNIWDTNISLHIEDPKHGLSVRCVKD